MGHRRGRPGPGRPLSGLHANGGGIVIRRRVVAHGRVQGVFFRESCRVEAEARGVAGTVRNRPDGAVEAVFEGDAGAVEAMTSWMGSGPAHALVEGVEVVDEPVAGERGFRIL